MEQYDEFERRLKEKHPEMFSRPYGGITVDEGWWPIIESLCGQIDHYVKWKNEQKEKYQRGEGCPQVVITQIKEKFGGLRFYYDGGDDRVFGMVSMAEAWADHTCEECGNPGKARHTGWIKTLCDEHAAEREARYKERFGNDAT